MGLNLKQKMRSLKNFIYLFLSFFTSNRNIVVRSSATRCTNHSTFTKHDWEDQNECFIFDSEDKNGWGTFDECSIYCDGKGASLPCIKNEQENKDFDKMIGGLMAWVGLFQLPNKTKAKETYIYWQSNNCTSTYRNWAPIQPDHYKCVRESCVTTASNGYFDFPCTSKHLCVCQFPGRAGEAYLDVKDELMKPRLSCKSPVIGWAWVAFLAFFSFPVFLYTIYLVRLDRKLRMSRINKRSALSAPLLLGWVAATLYLLIGVFMFMYEFFLAERCLKYIHPISLEAALATLPAVITSIPLISYIDFWTESAELAWNGLIKRKSRFVLVHRMIKIAVSTCFLTFLILFCIANYQSHVNFTKNLAQTTLFWFIVFWTSGVFLLTAWLLFTSIEIHCIIRREVLDEKVKEYLTSIKTTACITSFFFLSSCVLAVCVTSLGFLPGWLIAVCICLVLVIFVLSRSNEAALRRNLNFTQSKSKSKAKSNSEIVLTDRPSWIGCDISCDERKQGDVPPLKWSISIANVITFLECCMNTETWIALTSLKGDEAEINMYDLNEYFVIPWTKGKGCSIALLLEQVSSRNVELMISHAWSGSVIETLNAVKTLTTFYGLSPDTRVFFCTFCMYQAEDGALGGLSIAKQLDMDPFGKVISSNPPFGMFIIHTTSYEIYKRLWCVHEVDQCLLSGIEMKGLFDPNKWSLENFDSRKCIETKKSECNVRDRAMLIDLIESHGGFNRLDEIILKVRNIMRMNLDKVLKFEDIFGVNLINARESSIRSLSLRSSATPESLGSLRLSLEGSKKFKFSFRGLSS